MFWAKVRHWSFKAKTILETLPSPVTILLDDANARVTFISNQSLLIAVHAKMF
jgi:hypothetical protein